ncbi:LamG-like jellyroll fold domain-containing protein [Rubinisphaera margarita]|uniref:LamG-like jellyroll fold domain-containing protein n=1 Tax=Rubinisphaera margarita TaxID=2909586 RepID=UPI001EE7F427|nr:LamG-like jellyroll fold domain-containing protein [Rubinisphaera margarita]MCG6155897.1 FecR domain-containing protein [Rubinisphaera margarita]
MKNTELRQLIDAALEGQISEADFLRLEAELSVDPEARQEYYDRILLTQLLAAEAGEQNGEQQAPTPTTRARVAVRHWRWAFAGMASVCAALLAVMIAQRPDAPVIIGQPRVAEAQGETGEQREQESSGYAIVSGQVDPIWADETTLAHGSMVPPGELHLQSGVAQFELFSGVTLVVEGEARFSILSPMEVLVTQGKVRARVPEPAQGFRVLTDAGEVVDLGTEFAVDVTAEGSEVHVLDGEIDWHPRGLPAQRLEQGDATRLAGGVEVPIAANSSRFVGPEELQQRLKNRAETRISQWEATTRELAEDPELIAHYQMSSSRRRLENLAEATREPASEGAVVAAAPAADRWGRPAQALDFSPAGSRVRVHVPGEYQNLTMICWVKINSLDRWYNSLFLTDGHELGEPHWQIMDDGRLFFSVKKYEPPFEKGMQDKHIFYSPKFWDTSLSGRWLMLATVYDGTQKQVTHYLNGSILNREEIPEEYLVDKIHIGDASLCNWGLPSRNQPRFAIRNLNGSLDEFMLFSEPLSEQDIQQLYDVGKP